jgi:hypothetical protein
VFPERRRKKKLIVAFHFQFTNQAGWKCDACRKAGLDQKRRCGWLGPAKGPGGRPVWSRRGHLLTQCPKSYITAGSLTLLEEFNVRKLTGAAEIDGLGSRTVEAICILEQELRSEMEQRNE